ncbi:MAG: hypothetical protein U0270_01355 [Labilithrix sp.]
MQQPPQGYGPPAGGFGGPYPPPGYPNGHPNAGYAPATICTRCGRPHADHRIGTAMPVHRACAGLGPDTLGTGWIVLAYLVTIPLGCSFIGALVASIPYYVWKADYPNKARAYNRHVWIAFAISCVMWILWMVLVGNSGR